MLDIFKTGKRLLNFVGTVRSEKHNLFGNIRIVIALFLLTATCVLQVLDVVFNYESIESIGKADVTPLFSRNVAVVALYAAFRQDWKQLMKSIKSNFWDVKTLDPEFQAISRSMEQFTAKCATILILILIGGYSFYLVAPAIFHELPFKVYKVCDVSKYPCYIGNYVFLCIATMENAASAVGFDMIYFYVIQKIYIELEAVKFYLARMDCSKDFRLVDKEISVLVNQHVLILSVVKDFRNLVRIKFIILYGTTTISICFGFFLMTLHGIPPPMEDFAKYSLWLGSFIFEIILYCLGGTIIMAQSASVSKAIYDTNWIDGNTTSTKSLSLMILRANKDEVLDIGGIIKMNLELFPEILKTAFSFYTLMDSMSKLDK